MLLDELRAWSGPPPSDDALSVAVDHIARSAEQEAAGRTGVAPTFGMLAGDLKNLSRIFRNGLANDISDPNGRDPYYLPPDSSLRGLAVILDAEAQRTLEDLGKTGSSGTSRAESDPVSGPGAARSRSSFPCDWNRRPRSTRSGETGEGPSVGPWSRPMSAGTGWAGSAPRTALASITTYGRRGSRAAPSGWADAISRPRRELRPGCCSTLAPCRSRSRPAGGDPDGAARPEIRALAEAFRDILRDAKATEVQHAKG